MNCPKCGSNMSDKKKRCDRCGTDLTIYRKILRVSNLYYNNGLARAKVRDLSGAVIALRKSLDLNKLNTNARNLLGLIYYEMGETVAALSEWVISKHFQPQNNEADEYINKVQSNPTRLDAFNQAIKRYNTALNFSKQGSDDLAIIQLKKVISLNPHFIRAYHLLALLHMKAGDNEKAKKYLIKAAKIDVTNTMTLRYMQELEAPAAKDFDANPEAESSNTNKIIPISSYKEDKPNIMLFVNLVIGVIIGIAVTSFLIIPTIKKNIMTDDNTGYTDNASSVAQLEKKDNEISTLTSQISDLNQQIEQLQAQINNTMIPEDQIGAYESLFTATDLYFDELDKAESEKDFTTIADTLAPLDESQFSEEAAINLLTRLRNATYPIVAQIHYDKGHELYSNTKYEEALTELAKAITFDPLDVDAIYFTARSYDRLEDKVNAAVYYNKVITDFPDSNRVTDSKSYLEKLQQ
ncbi:MAG: tetratricopeptide repeat protein [Herbinix sp.]|nr:tetratricopeptide repeat protein [Herbinix sp.]